VGGQRRHCPPRWWRRPVGQGRRRGRRTDDGEVVGGGSGDGELLGGGSGGGGTAEATRDRSGREKATERLGRAGLRGRDGGTTVVGRRGERRKTTSGRGL
jgi:hypothetical protein